MLKNSIKTTLRCIKHSKLFSFINITGLAAGIACCIFISIWVRHELSFDLFHEKIDNIYLVRANRRSNEAVAQTSGTPPSLGPALESDYPEVARVVRLFHWQPELLMRNGEAVFREKVQFSDPSLFEVFTFPIMKGQKPEVAARPDIMVISENLAIRLFKDQDPVGRTITIDNRIDMTIAAVMKNLPAQSSLRFDVWMPLKATERIFNLPEFLNSWGNNAFRTYVQLHPAVEPGTFSARIAGRIKQADPRSDLELYVYPYRDLYLQLQGHGKRVRMFSLIAVLILLMACINFANLSTARSEKRAKEVGIRKVVGAPRSLLVRQFLGESLFFAFISLALALGLVMLFLPLFRGLTGIAISVGTLGAAVPWPLIILLTILAGLVSGIYPAFVLSAMKPARTVKGSALFSQKRGFLRKALVLVQSSLSVVFIICFVVVSSQIRFMKTRNPGYSKESILSVPVQGELARSYAAVKTELQNNPGIEHVAMTTDSPLYIGSIVVGGRWEGMDLEASPSITMFGVDADFLKTFKVAMAKGRFFGPETAPVSRNVVVNETLAAMMGRQEVIGARISALDDDFTVIGVVRDFNYRPLDQDLEPLMMFHNTDIMPYRFMFLKLVADRIPQTLASIGDIQGRFNLDAPLEYTYLDEQAAAQYGDEDRLQVLITVFMYLAVLISSLGLFGLSVFMVERRTREIGIRKVLGASTQRITALLSMGFLNWVLLSNLIAWPAGYLLMSEWLRNFAFRIDLGLWIFALSAAILFAVGVTTVSTQALRAASASPVKSLMYQ